MNFSEVKKNEMKVYEGEHKFMKSSWDRLLSKYASKNNRLSISDRISHSTQVWLCPSCSCTITDNSMGPNSVRYLSTSNFNNTLREFIAFISIRSYSITESIMNNLTGIRTVIKPRVNSEDNWTLLCYPMDKARYSNRVRQQSIHWLE